VNGSKASSVVCGQLYTFKVDNYSASQIWLVQTKNLAQSFNGIYNVPQAYTATCNRDEGDYNNEVYAVASGQKGGLLGTIIFKIKASGTVASTPSLPTEPGFYQQSFKVSSVICGQAYSFGISNFSEPQIWLVQTKNSAKSYDGAYSVPVTYTSQCNRDEGVYTNTAYKFVNGQKGDLLGSADFEVKSLASQLPDFYPSIGLISPKLETEVNAIEVNKAVVAQFTIYNGGAKAYKPEIEVQFSGLSMPMGQTTNVAENTCNTKTYLDKNESCVYAVRVTYGQAGSNYSIKLQINPNNYQTETNKNNNSSSLAFDVKAKQLAASPAFYLGLNKIDSIVCGGVYTFKVDNYSDSQVWLEQNKIRNGLIVSSFSGLYFVPATYTSVCQRTGDSQGDSGLYFTYVYKALSGKKGDYLGNVTFTINPKVFGAFIKASQPPQAPTIAGPQVLPQMEAGTFWGYAKDSDSKLLGYVIDWGDGSPVEQIIQKIGYNYHAKHAWENPGVYTIKVFAQDESGNVSPVVSYPVQVE
jgi:hypothetical protein